MLHTKPVFNKQVFINNIRRKRKEKGWNTFKLKRNHCIYCKYGKKMRRLSQRIVFGKIKSNRKLNKYKPLVGVICSRCRRTINSSEDVYRCETYTCPHNSDGYGLCIDCCKEQVKARQSMYNIFKIFDNNRFTQILIYRRSNISIQRKF